MTNDERGVASASQVPTLPGDLGRRVRYWRERAKMTREDLAERAGMSTGYLEYLETRPTAQPSESAVARIAAVLSTSIAELLGGNVERALGAAPAVRQPHLVALDSERSWALIGKAGVGRIVFNSSDGPIALPVNYAVSKHDVFLRTDEDTVIAKIDADERVSFEADHIDDAMSKGWSVVVSASCEHLGTDCNISEIFDVRVDPWAGGRREHWIRLRARAIAGRAIETDL
jgi:transcriptional regulator with XRE-family HTH domain